jgi:hypothetical protein
LKKNISSAKKRTKKLKKAARARKEKLALPKDLNRIKTNKGRGRSRAKNDRGRELKRTSRKREKSKRGIESSLIQKRASKKMNNRLKSGRNQELGGQKTSRKKMRISKRKSCQLFISHK